MSMRTLLAQRGTVLRAARTSVDGASAYVWSPVKTNVRLRIDLSFTRRGKDPTWSPETGRIEDRTGVAFFMPDEDVRPGDRVKLTAGGLTGTFELKGALDPVMGRRGRVHHIEVGVEEVAKALE